MIGVPAQTVEATLAGMATLGVDVAAIRAQAGLPTEAPTPGDRWPIDSMRVAWERTLGQIPRSSVAVEVGFGVPFGAFGVVDYLIGSSDTMGGALHALVEHIEGVAENPVLMLVEESDGLRLEVRVRPSPVKWVGEEFSLGVTLKNLRHIADGAVPATEMWTTRSDPGDGALSSALGFPVRFDAPVAALRFAASMSSLPSRTADPQLHRAMEALVASLGLGDTRDPLERAIRARLRDQLPRGEPGAALVARTLGMSERTLHRRLQDNRTTWRDVIDAFRCDESKRLLRDARQTLGDIALALGFSDQTAWTRAFRRWTGESPTQWARQHR